PTWNWRSPFDEGEYGLGQLAVALRPGHEVPEHAALLPAVLADDRGTGEPKAGVIAVYEEDGGILWSHTTLDPDPDRPRTETRRARQLVVHTLLALGNYDYGVRWVFRQDGVIEFQVELTGIPLAKAVQDEKCPACAQEAGARDFATGADRYGELVAPNLVAVHHQHFFCLRLDLDVDGPENSVLEANVLPVPPGQDNPGRNAFLVERRLLGSELEARRDLSLASARTWKVFNPGRKTTLGHFPGYTLQPSGNAVPYAHRTAPARRR